MQSLVTKKRPSHPGKSENEGFNESHCAPAKWTGLILLFDGEVGPAEGDLDEHNQAGILTSGLMPRSRLPASPHAGGAEQWQWESVARYSGATVPDSHGVPCAWL